MDLGPHSVFIIASYALAAAVICGLAAWLYLDGKRQSRRLAELEARGIKRRSDAA